jgi:PEP-CTERM motif
MNRSIYLTACACTLAFLLTGTNSRAAAISFDALGDFTNNFNVAINSDLNKTSGFSESSGSGGILGSPGSILYTQNTNNDSTAFYKILGLDFSSDGSLLTESVMFHTGGGSATGGQRVVQLGFGTNFTSPFNGGAQQQQGGSPNFSAFTSVRINTTTTLNSYTIEGQDKPIGNATTGASTFGTTPAFSLTANTWFRLTITVTNLPGTDYSIGGVVESFGADGVTFGGTVGTFPVTTRNTVPQTGIDLATTLFGGFRASAGATNVTNYDTYSVIPEPTSIGVLVGGLGLFFVLRRRKLAS